MRERGESVEDARIRMEAFIAHELRRAQQDPRNAFFYYGRALHPIMDSTSPEHEGFQVWSPFRNPFRAARHGGVGEGVAELTPQRRRLNERAVRAYAPNLADLCKVY